MDSAVIKTAGIGKTFLGHLNFDQTMESADLMERLRSEAGQKRHYNDVRNRLMGGVNRPMRSLGDTRDFFRNAPAPLPVDDPAWREKVAFEESIADSPNYQWRRILLEVSNKHRIGIKVITGAAQTRDIAAARHEAMYRMREEAGMSCTAIGRKLNRDHTSVLSGIRRHEERNAL